MIGAIIGDIAGSRFEFNNWRQKGGYALLGDGFMKGRGKCYFTDDTVMTCAVAKALLNTARGKDFEQRFKTTLIKSMKQLAQVYPNAGYGSKFYYWVLSDRTEPYNSCGNGSAMRVSPVIWYAESEEECETLAKWSAEITHNHPEGIKGAVVTAVAGYKARSGATKDDITKYIKQFYPNAGQDWREIAKVQEHIETCQNALPVAMSAFIQGENYEDTIRTAIACGGDSDTIAAIAGAVAEAFYGVPGELVEQGLRYLPDDLKGITTAFMQRFTGGDYGDKL